jgi:hypothetical protein
LPQKFTSKLFTYGQNTLVQHRLCRRGDYDQIGLIHLDLVKFPLGISKPHLKLRACHEEVASTKRGSDKHAFHAKPPDDRFCSPINTGMDLDASCQL